MKKLSLLFYGAVCIVPLSFGMEQGFQIDQGNSGKVVIRESRGSSLVLDLGKSGVLGNFVFCNEKDGVILTPNIGGDEHENESVRSLVIDSSKSIALQNVIVGMCCIKSRQLVLSKKNIILDLILSNSNTSITINKDSSFNVGRIDFDKSVIGVNSLNINGILTGEIVKIYGNNLTIRNNGYIDVDQLELSNNERESNIEFLQYGTVSANKLVQYSRLFQNCGATEIEVFDVPTSTSINVSTGYALISLLQGNIRGLTLDIEGQMKVGKIQGHMDFFRNRSSIFEVDEVDLDAPTTSNSRGGSSTYFGQCTNKIDYLISADSTSIANNAKIDTVDVIESGQFASNSSEIKRLMLESSSRAQVNGSHVKFLNLKERSKAHLDKSAVDTLRLKNSFVLSDRSQINSLSIDKQSFGKIQRSKVGNLDNQGTLAAAYTGIGYLRNSLTSIFTNWNSVNVLENDANVVNRGKAYINQYIGGNDNSQITTIGTPEGKKLGTRKGYSIAHLDTGAATYIKKAYGKGKMVAPKQIYSGHMLQGFELVGNVDVFIDYMPEVSEISKHRDGYFKVHATLDKDYVNESNKNYGDVIFFIDMNDHNWSNLNADFRAKGLDVRNAGLFQNYDGRIYLEDFLRVKAEQILNAATLIPRENGRWVHGSACGQPMHFYMPATYYQRNPNTGIFVGEEGIKMKAAKSIKNVGSNIRTDGNFRAKVINGEFRNRVGEIYGAEKGIISADTIINEDLGTTVRRGEFHASGSSGFWIFGSSWSFDLYIAELVNKSEGSKMIFGDKVKITGNEIKVIGSKIGSNEVDIDCKVQDFRSVIENITEVGSNVHLKGDKFYGIAMKIWSIQENSNEQN